jgi:hypothetical protein
MVSSSEGKGRDKQPASLAKKKVIQTARRAARDWFGLRHDQFARIAQPPGVELHQAEARYRFCGPDVEDALQIGTRCEIQYELAQSVDVDWIAQLVSGRHNGAARAEVRLQLSSRALVPGLQPPSYHQRRGARSPRRARVWFTRCSASALVRP